MLKGTLTVRISVLQDEELMGFLLDMFLIIPLACGICRNMDVLTFMQVQLASTERLIRY